MSGMLFVKMKNNAWIRWWDYLDSLQEYGPSITVGVGNIKLFQRMINEIYKAGFQDGERQGRERVRS